jgi:hypothetical protein
MDEQQRNGIVPVRTMMNKVEGHWVSGIVNHGFDNGRELFQP